MPRNANKQYIDLTQSNSAYDVNIKSETEPKFIDLTREVKEEEQAAQREEQIRDKLQLQPNLCDIRRVKNRAALLLELWYMATNGEPEQLGNTPTVKDAQLVIQKPVNVFFGARIYSDLYGDLADFTVYDKYSGGTGSGKRCVATILSRQLRQLDL